MDVKLNDMCENCQYRKSAEKNKSPDLGQMVKLAMMVSKMFGQTSPPKQLAPGPLQQPQNIQPVQSPAVTNVDALIEDKPIRIIKSALPFLDHSLQQPMHLFVKCLEMKNIMNASLYPVGMRPAHNSQQQSIAMLNAVKPHLDPKERYAVEIAGKALEMINIMSIMGGMKPEEIEDDTGNLKEDSNGLPRFAANLDLGQPS